MSAQIEPQDLETYLAEMEPRDFEAQYGERLSPEARIEFDNFVKMCADLDQLHTDLATIMPPVPEVDLHKARVVPIPLWRRKVIMPAWGLPLAMAAAITVGVLLPSLERSPAEPSFDVNRKRGSEIDSPLPSYDRGIGIAFIERAKRHQMGGNCEGAWLDYRHALNYIEDDEPERYMVIQEMRICAEQLGDAHKMSIVEQLEQ